MNKASSNQYANISRFPGREESPAELYHENSKLRRHQWWKDDNCTVRSGPRFRDAEKKLSRLYDRLAGLFKSYTHAELYPLPDVTAEQLPALSEVILARRSCRAYSGAPIQLKDLAILLHFSYGVTQRMILESGQKVLMRAAPSGGALYPLEIYPLVMRVTGLPDGIYHYRADINTLELLSRGVPMDLLYENTAEKALERAACVFAVTGVFARQSLKYGERAYRFTMMDAGFMIEHLYLVATALQLGGCVYGGFIDDGINGMLGLDGASESALALFAVGGH